MEIKHRRGFLFLLKSVYKAPLHDRISQTSSPTASGPVYRCCPLHSPAGCEPEGTERRRIKRPNSLCETASQTGHTRRYLLGDVGRGRYVEDGQQSGWVCSPLVVQTVLHGHGDGSDLIPKLTVVLGERRKHTSALAVKSCFS